MVGALGTVRGTTAAAVWDVMLTPKALFARTLSM
jgi:hypothetical protein